MVVECKPVDEADGEVDGNPDEVLGVDELVDTATPPQQQSGEGAQPAGVANL